MTGGSQDDSESGSRLLSHLAHKVRTPLAVVLGYAELLQVREDADLRRQAAGRIMEAADQLSYVVDDLLTLFAIDSGALELEPEPVDLEAAVDDTIRLVEPRVAKHTFVLASPGDGPWPFVSADPEHLTRIVTNLLVSAVSFSPDGGQVTVSVRRDDRFAELSVASEGVGLGEEQLATVFERLSLLDVPEAAGVPASGLELYEARRLVELHGGSVSAESEPGTGSSFTVTIPLAGDEDGG